MRQELDLEISRPIIGLADNIIYSQSPLWCNATYQQLHLSLMRPRQYYSYDRKGCYPLIVFLCGGGFEQMDRNVWMGELAWFVKRGYAVAGVEYSTLPRTKWPTQAVNVKEAIRFIRAHAEEFAILPDRIAVMGESAGGYLAAFTGLTGDNLQYKTAASPELSDAVRAVVAWYPPTDLNALQNRHDLSVSGTTGTPSRSTVMDLTGAPDLGTLVTADTPPFFLMHGTEDQLVPASHSERLYKLLTEKNVPAELYILRGAHHNDVHFVQDCMKERILKFLRRYVA